jgi:hypothetical protein
MSTTRNGLTSFLAGEAIAGARRVKLDSTPVANQVLLAGAADVSIGFSLLEVSSVAIGLPVPVRLNNEGGSCFATASGVIAVNAIIYGAASGKVAGSGTVAVGRALEAAAADGDIIEIVPGAA